MISSDLAVLRSTINRPTGTIIAPPMPWNTRATVSTPSVGATAQPMDATVNTAIARENTPRAPYRSLSQPLAGMSTATVSR